jgi:hypothetical protein
MSFPEFPSIRSLTHDLLEDLTGLQPTGYSSVEHTSSINAAQNFHVSAIAEGLAHRGHHVRTVMHAEVYSPDDRALTSFPRPPSPTLSASSLSSTDSDQGSVATSSRRSGLPYHRIVSASSRPGLRRKKSPQEATLRQLRIKQSEADLKKMYEQQTLSYLDGTLPGSPISPTVPQFRMLLTIPE